MGIKKRFLGSMEDLLLTSGIFLQSEKDLCKSVNELLLNNRTKDFYVSSGNLPFFVYNNLETIQSRVLKNGFKLKIATFNKPTLPGFLTITENFYNLQNAIEIYKLKEIPKNICALFGENNFVFSRDGERFNLESHAKRKYVENYKNDFYQAKTKSEKIPIEDCFS